MTSTKCGSVVPVGQCLSNLFLKPKGSLAICEIIANDGSMIMVPCRWCGKRGQQQWGVLQQ